MSPWDLSSEPRSNVLQVCTHRLPCADRKQTQGDRIGDWRQSYKPIRFVRTTVSTSAHTPQNGHFHSIIEKKPSIEGGVSHSSQPRLSLTYPCERGAMISFPPSAEFSDAKVLNVLTRSCAQHRDLTTKTGIFLAAATFTRLYFPLSKIYFPAAQRLAEFSDVKVLNVVTRSSPKRPKLLTRFFSQRIDDRFADLRFL